MISLKRELYTDLGDYKKIIIPMHVWAATRNEQLVKRSACLLRKGETFEDSKYRIDASF
jgi:hypothetical protein